MLRIHYSMSERGFRVPVVREIVPGSEEALTESMARQRQVFLESPVFKEFHRQEIQDERDLPTL